MNIEITLSDEKYQALEAIAKAQGQTPAKVLNTLVEEYLAEPDPDADFAAGRYTTYHSTDEFMRALGADETMLAKARERDKEWAEQEAAQTRTIDANL